MYVHNNMRKILNANSPFLSFLEDKSLSGEGGRLGCCLQRAAPLYALAASLPTQPLLMPEKAEKGVPRV